MKYKQTIITKIDLKKILRRRGITLYRLSKLSGVKYPTLFNARAGKIVLSERSWNLIKPFL